VNLPTDENVGSRSPAAKAFATAAKTARHSNNEGRRRESSPHAITLCFECGVPQALRDKVLGASASGRSESCSCWRLSGVGNAGIRTGISIHIYGTGVCRLGSSVRPEYDLPVLPARAAA
jgi:hypothetical protein